MQLYQWDLQTVLPDQQLKCLPAATQPGKEGTVEQRTKANPRTKAKLFLFYTESGNSVGMLKSVCVWTAPGPGQPGENSSPSSYLRP